MARNDTAMLAFSRAEYCATHRQHDSVPYTVDPRDLGRIEAPDLRRMLDHIILHPGVVYGLESLRLSGVLGMLLPELTPIMGFGGGNSGHKDLWWHTKGVVSQTPPQADMRWAALFHDVGKPSTFVKKGGKVEFHGHEWRGFVIWEALRKRTALFDNDGIRIGRMIRDLGRVEAYASDWTDGAVRRLDREVGEWLEDTIDVASADCTSKHQWKRDRNFARMDELGRRLVELRKEDATPRPLPKGLGLLVADHLGIKPGRELGDAMKRLTERVEAGELLRAQEPEYYLEHLEA